MTDHQYIQIIMMILVYDFLFFAVGLSNPPCKPPNFDNVRLLISVFAFQGASFYELRSNTNIKNYAHVNKR